MSQSPQPPPRPSRPGKDVVKRAIAKNSMTRNSLTRLPPPGRAGVKRRPPPGRAGASNKPPPRTGVTNKPPPPKRGSHKTAKPLPPLKIATNFSSSTSSVPNSADTVSPEKAAKNAIKRLRIVKEIVETEENYVTQLQTLQRLYINPMKDGSILPINTCNSIFSNVTSIMETNLNFLIQLHKEVKKEPDQQELGKLFVDFSDVLQMYHGYCRKNVLACREITQLLKPKSNQPKFRDLHAKCMQDQFSNGLSLNGLLITPIQRVPRYRMLLAELIKVTPTTHPDYQALNAALETIKAAAAQINEAVREEENRMQLREIQEEIIGVKGLDSTSRKLVKRGVLTKVCRRDDKDFTFYLFNDMLMYGEKQRGGKVKINHEIPISGTFQVTVLPDEENKPKNRWTIVNDVKSFVVYSKDDKLYSEWFKKMEEAAAEVVSVPSSLGPGTPKPIWTSDADADSCLKCQKSFTLTFRRHHCRICGDLVCDPCSKARVVLPGADVHSKKVRACETCAVLQVESSGKNRKNPNSLLEDYLQKKSRKHTKWNLRYCILVGDKLVYYQDDSLKKQLGEIDLNLCADDDIMADVEIKKMAINDYEEGGDKKRGSHSKNMSGSFRFKSLNLAESASVSDLDISIGRDSAIFGKSSTPTSKVKQKEAIIKYWVFTISLPAKDYCFRANTEEQRDKWVKNIRERKQFNLKLVQRKKIPNSLKEGILRKQGGKVKNWQERYFVLTLNSLKYYKELTDTKPAGEIDLKKGASLKNEESVDTTFMFTIAPGGAKRKYFLAAASENEREEWTEAIRLRNSLHDAMEAEVTKKKALTPKLVPRSFTPKGSIKVMGFQ